MSLTETAGVVPCVGSAPVQSTTQPMTEGAPVSDVRYLEAVRDVRYLEDGRVVLSLSTRKGPLECVLPAALLIELVAKSAALVSDHAHQFLTSVPLF